MTKRSNSTLAYWVSAARLRTLPLAFAVIALGGGLASFHEKNSFEISIFLLALLTSFSYQVLSNYANDLGDGLRGTDAEKKGEQRAIASGLISIKAMKKAVLVFTWLALISGATLITLAFTSIELQIIFHVLNLAAIWAARSYTMGSNPYAYWGGGDLFVLVFFGYLGVLGSEALFTESFFWVDLLPATVAGVGSAAVLTLNNLRDFEGDAKHGKITLVVRYGEKWGRGYFKTLVAIAILSSLSFGIYAAISLQHSAPLVVFLVFLFALRQVLKKFVVAHDPESLDPLLKPMALVTLLYCVGTALSVGIL